MSDHVDKRITSALNLPNAFTGKVNNSANIGKTTEEIVSMWNEEHPTDPINAHRDQIPSKLASPCLYIG